MKGILFYNGQIYNMYQSAVYDWLLIREGRIAAVGSKKDRPFLQGIQSAADLQGRVVIPAFIDAHMHLIFSALAHFRVQLKGCISLSQALQSLKQYAAHANKNDWIQGGGFNRNTWRDAIPHRRYLDDIFPNNPVALYSVDMHSLWVNTRALQISGLFNTTKTVTSGKIDRDKDGLPSGLLYEDAMKPVLDKIPSLTISEVKQALNKFYPYLYKLGITAVHTMENFADFNLLRRIHKEKELGIRSTVYIYQQDMHELINEKLISYQGDEWLRLGGVKLFTDGSLGSRTAHLFQPYEGEPENYGVEVTGDEELYAILREAAEHRLAAAVHAIGDRAVSKVIDVFSRLKNVYTKNNLVARIEHVQLIKPEDIRHIARLGAVASVQPVHIADDVYLAEQYWGKRSAYAYAFRPLIEAGVSLAFGSDSPVADPDPLKGIFSAVHRRFALDINNPIWQPQLAIDAFEAIKAYTQGSARAARQQLVRGGLQPGKQADFVVLSDNPFKAGAEELLSIRVMMTVQNGSIVYSEES